MRFVALSSLLLFPVLATASPHGCPPGTRIDGRYVAPKPKGHLPGTLVVAPSNKEDTFRFELESYWAPEPDDDGSSTTQGIFSGEFQVRWCVGHYADPEDNCFLVFNFGKNQVKVTSFGSCFYGYNAHPDAIYFRRSTQQ